MVHLAETDLCTGCGACAFVCTKGAITMKEDKLGTLLPVITASACVECCLCVNTCPVLNMPECHKPQKAYVAWSADAEEKRTSASGGVAAEAYRYAIKNGWQIAGAVQNEDLSVEMQLSDSLDILPAFKNSKYVFSSAYNLYRELKQLLESGRKCIVIGLPCQVAAIRKIFYDNENIMLVELVCHGTISTSILQNHIHLLEKQLNIHCARMSFRDADLGTQNFYLTMYDKAGERFYAKRTKDGETYLFAYHRSVAYRENCYHCPFSQYARVADITINDYKQLGKCAPSAYKNERGRSSILCNTEKGITFINDLIASRQIVSEQRPVAEPVNADARLVSPSPKNKWRMIYEQQVHDVSAFEESISPMMHAYLKEDKRKRTIFTIKSLPKRIVKAIAKNISW